LGLLQRFREKKITDKGKEGFEDRILLSQPFRIVNGE